VERRLADLADRADRADRGGPAADAASFDGDFGRRLRSALEELGPAFAAFGAYLASRPDLLPIADLLALRSIREEVEPWSPGALRGRIEEEIGRPLHQVFAAFDELPVRCRLAEEVHRARLRDGRPCWVAVAPPAAGLEPEVDLLPLLGEALRRHGLAAPMERVVADFRAVLSERADLARRAADLDRLRREGERRRTFQAPRVERELSTPRLLVAVESPEPAAAAGARGPAERIDLARRLCLAWLRQALSGGLFPVELDADDLRRLPGGSIELAAPLFAALPPASRANLFDYLLAVAADRPAEACDLLLAEMDLGALEVEAAADGLRQRFRQAVPFATGGWGGDGHDLAAQLFLQLRLAAEGGCRPEPPLRDFYRGLFAVTAVCRELAPEDDPLREVLAELRFLDTLDRLERMAEPDRLRQGLESYAGLVADLPIVLDETLRRSSEGRLRVRLDLDGEGGRQDRRGDLAALATALLLALAAVVLLTRRLAAPEALGPVAEAVGAGLFLILGALLLRTIARQG
jgi:hypothetical protein